MSLTKTKIIIIIIKEELTNLENEIMVTRGEGRWGGGINWEFGIDRCKLLYIGWINKKVLLYSTGNYSQCPVISHDGKEHEIEYIYIYIYNCITLLYSRN